MMPVLSSPFFDEGREMANGEPARDENEQPEEMRFSDAVEQAKAYLRDEELEKAIEAFALAASLERALPEPEATRLGEALGRRVELYEAWGRALAGLQRLEQARWQNRKAIDSLLSLAELRLDAGDHKVALDCVDYAVEIGSRDGGLPEETLFTAEWVCGRALLVAELYEEALERLGVASELAARMGTEQQVGAVHYLLGIAEIGLNQHDEAVASFQTASQTNPALAIFAQNAAFSTLWHRGKYQQAWSKLVHIERLERTQSTHLDPLARAAELYQLGLARFYRGDYDTAQRRFEESKLLNNRSISLWATLIDFYLERREHDLEEPNKWYWRARDAYERTKADLDRRAKENPDAPTLVKLGVLSTAIEDYEAAEIYLQRAVDLGGSTPSIQANLGLICLRRGNFSEAAARFDAAVRSEPDNLVMRGLLADSYARLKLADRAEAEYRGIIRTAPGNIEAHIGLGEVATGLAESGDADLYLEAIREFDIALKLDTSMNGPLHTRESSTRLSRRQRAAVRYSRGYACGKLFEERASRKTLALLDAISLLPAARSDFEAALKDDPGHFRAQRALVKLGKPIREIAKRGIEELAAVVVAIVSLGILIFIQVSFLSGSDRVQMNQYVVLTFGLLMFLVAALYLPAISKLKVGGAELEKTVTEQVSAPVALGLARAEAAATNVRAFFVEWDQGPPSEVAEKTVPAREAFESLRRDQEKAASVVDAGPAAGRE